MLSGHSGEMEACAKTSSDGGGALTAYKCKIPLVGGHCALDTFCSCTSSFAWQVSVGGPHSIPRCASLLSLWRPAKPSHPYVYGEGEKIKQPGSAVRAMPAARWPSHSGRLWIVILREQNETWDMIDERISVLRINMLNMNLVWFPLLSSTPFD